MERVKFGLRRANLGKCKELDEFSLTPGRNKRGGEGEENRDNTTENRMLRVQKSVVLIPILITILVSLLPFSLMIASQITE